ncbi:MAG: cadmium-translocating P-type ATPase [Clostridia bacterium]|nr:cadmium-translocating P-type ATPase [Clostridia bacterium]
MTKKQKKALIRILIAAALLTVLMLTPSFGQLKLILYAAVYLEIGYDVLRKAGLGILRGRVFDENFLMALATLGAFVLAGISGSGECAEGVAVMLFYQIGEWFQSIAVGRSRKSISDLMEIRPDSANLEENGTVRSVSPEEVPAGSVIVLRPGERVPLDGVVLEGNSALDTSALTGDSVPRDVGPGDSVLSGCINQSGVLRVRTTQSFGESIVSKILDLVENAASRKSRSESLVSRFAKYYTPAVCAGAVLLALLPPLVLLLSGKDADWMTWVYRALTFLVVSCPCALVISVPLSFFAGIGCAGKHGILVKGSQYLETLARTGSVVFDKTGTLTHGTLEVTGIHHCPIGEELLIELAALAESASTHPIGKSIRDAYGKEIDGERVSEIREYAGMGITALADGHEVAAGNGKLMDRIGIPYTPCHTVGTIVHLAVDGVYAGHLVISDRIREQSREAVLGLREAGVREVIMLTGDSGAVAESVAGLLGIDTVYAELLPEEKVTRLESVLNSAEAGEAVAFVGDGINDAPALMRADVGIAMGAIGSDAAIEAADVVLMHDNPFQVAKAIRIARKCLSIVRENIGLSIGIKAACLILTALGLSNMWLAVFADVGVMILATLNSFRAFRLSEKNRRIASP